MSVLAGRVNDLDAHEVLPAKLWGEQFGGVGEMLLQLFPKDLDTYGIDDLLTDNDRDDIEITSDATWRRVGWEKEICRAPGVVDMTRREQVLDVMGIRRQYVFPSFGTTGFMLLTATPSFLSAFIGIDEALMPDQATMRMMGATMITEYNNWVIKQLSGINGDRVRMVGLVPTLDLEAAMAETERLVSAGVKTIAIPASVPPDGKSPADRAIDPFWSLCEQKGIPVVMHAALESVLATDVWRRIPEFEIEKTKSAEAIVEPWSMATMHIPAEVFLTTTILGGVFERHPDLRLGLIEFGAQWVSPLADRLDLWASQFKRRMAKTLSMPPSGYFQRNLRVNPFTFEPVDTYFERHDLDDVYCFGSDYPHYEGGTDQLAKLEERLAPLGEEIMEKFFVTNAELLLGDRSPSLV